MINLNNTTDQRGVQSRNYAGNTTNGHNEAQSLYCEESSTTKFNRAVIRTRVTRPSSFGLAGGGTSYASPNIASKQIMKSPYSPFG